MKRSDDDDDDGGDDDDDDGDDGDDGVGTSLVCHPILQAFPIRFISSFLVTSPIEPRSRLAIEKAIYEVIVPTPSLPPPLTHPHFTQSGGRIQKSVYSLFFSASEKGCSLAEMPVMGVNWTANI